MADPSPVPDFVPASGANPDATRAKFERDSPPGTPRWVKAFGIIVLVLVLLFVIVHLTGGGFRGHTAPVTYTERVVPQP